MRDALDDELASASEQQSQNWFDIRIGRFTSSEIHRLIKSGSRPMTELELANRPKKGPGSSAKLTEDNSKFSPDGETYVYEKVAETLTGQILTGGFSQATQWGDDLEPIAAEYFIQKMGYTHEIISFFPFGDHAGGSPDRVVNGNELLEIKCPFNSTNQVKYLMLTDQADLKSLYPEFYWQVMANLFFTQKTLCHFVTYDHRFTKEEHKMSWIKVEPSQTDFQLIADKLAAAIKMKLEWLQTLNRI